jgi:hypothetical protein
MHGEKLVMIPYMVIEPLYYSRANEIFRRVEEAHS